MKVFGKWDNIEAEVLDPGVRGYMNLMPRAVMHSGGKHAKQQFKKSEQHIVERLVNKMMRKERNTGKKFKLVNVPVTPADLETLRKAVAAISLPTWAEICDKSNPGCSDAWKKTVGKAIGVQ